MLSESILAIKNIRENTTYLEFDQLLQFLKNANDLGLVDEFINEVHHIMYLDNTDLLTAMTMIDPEILKKLI
jgi:hypothetical protein